MGKSDATTDHKKAEKKAKKRAKKESKKEAKTKKEEAKRLKKEQKRREKEARTESQKKPQKPKPVAIPDDSPADQKLPKDALQNSVFFKKRIEVSLSLLPAAMKNIMMALQDSIRSMILKYTAKVGGVLLTFENIKIISNNGHGRILNELPYLHYQVAFDALVFCPEVGCKLQGAVTESFPSHLGILVLGYFNTMIPANCLTKAGYFYDEDLQEWSKEDGVSVFATDDKVDFLVDKIHESVGTLSFEGGAPSLSPFANKTAAPEVVDEDSE